MAVFFEVTRQDPVYLLTLGDQKGPGTHPIIMSLTFIDGNFPEYNILTFWTHIETITQLTLLFFIESTKVTNNNLPNDTFLLCRFFLTVSPSFPLVLPPYSLLLPLLSPLLSFLSSLPALLAPLLMLLQSGRIHRRCHLSAA